LKRFTQQILQALDYAHSSGVIHTELTPQNVMIQLPDESIIGDFVLDATADEILEEIEIELLEPCELESRNMRGFWLGTDEPTLEDCETLDIAICDWGMACSIDEHLFETISPLIFRTPEVFLGAGRSKPADIWMLGLVLLIMVDNVHLFDGRPDFGQTGEEYCTEHHLLEMKALFGPFPRALLDRGDVGLVVTWFDCGGRVKKPRNYNIDCPPLEELVTSLGKEDKRAFVDMVKKMLMLEPEERLLAKELLQMEWVRDVEF
jgi:serine/threonine-protein kinase SRPK3